MMYFPIIYLIKMGGNTQKTLTPEEQKKLIKEQTRSLEKSGRKIDREIKKIQ